jgi:transcriptional regulator with XRE-family HTH domain
MKHSTRAKLLQIFDGNRPVTGADRCWALAQAGMTQRQLAERLNLSRPTVSQALNDERTSYNVATGLAEVTGLSLNRLWPCGKYAVAPAERKRTAAAALKEAA